MPDAKKKTPKPAPPGPLPDGTPYCVHCKLHHRPPASKAAWAAAGMKCPNPFPTPKVPKPPVSVPAKQDKKMAERGRLPDGSSFAVTFDAAKVEWSGSLTIPGAADGMAVEFRGEAPGVFGLLVHLDRQYRAWAEKKGAKGP